MSRNRDAPLVSIIITSHNYGRYLRESVDSALAQTYGRVEVVVVDDGSTDDSPAILASYGDAIRVIRQTNAGQAAALNAGFGVSQGELVLLLDSDDALEPEAARSLVDAWRPDVARVQGLVRLVDEAGRPSGGGLPTDPIPSGDAAALVLRGGGYGATGTTGAAYARWCLERLLPIPEQEWRVAPDSYLLLLAPLVGPLGAVDRPLGRVRIHGSNKWSMKELDPRRLLEHLEVDRLKEALLRERGPGLGVDVPGRWLLDNPAHLQSRLALLRMAPELMPYRGDRRGVLALRGVGAALGHRGFAVRKRLFFAAWFVAAGLLPAPAARTVVRLGFLRSGRPAWLQRFIEAVPRRPAPTGSRGP